MLVLRRQAAQLLQLAAAAPAALAAQPPAGAALAAGWQRAAAAALSTSAARAAGGGGGGITGWLTNKVAGLVGGGEMEDLSLEEFATQLKRARQLGGLTGYVHGTGAVRDGSAQGTMRLFEQVIEAMTPAEKKDVSLFGREARERVAQQIGATTVQVDDCIARYMWTRQMTLKMAQLRKAGKPMPTSIDQLERELGTWRQYKTEHEAAGGSTVGAVPLGHLGFKGQPCPLAGAPVSRNTKCPASKKAFKACCGKTLRV